MSTGTLKILVTSSASFVEIPSCMDLSYPQNPAEGACKVLGEEVPVDPGG